MKRKALNIIFLVAALIIFYAVLTGFTLGGLYARAEESTETSAETSAETTGSTSSEDVSGTGESSNVGETDEPVKAPEYDLDDFLAWVQGYADEAGLGNEFAQALQAIKTAANEKQVTISTISSIASLAVVVGLIIVEKARKKQLASTLKEVSEQLKAQINGTNGLIDESNANGQTAADTNAKVAGLETALKNVVKGLAVLSSRTNIGTAYKEQIQEEFNAAERALGGAADENHKAQ